MRVALDGRKETKDYTMVLKRRINSKRQKGIPEFPYVPVRSKALGIQYAHKAGQTNPDLAS